MTRHYNPVLKAFSSALNRRISSLSEDATYNDENEISILTDEGENIKNFLRRINTAHKNSVLSAARSCLEQAEIYKSDGRGWRAEGWEEAAEILARYAGKRPHGTWWEWCALPKEIILTGNKTYGDVRMTWLDFHWNGPLWIERPLQGAKEVHGITYWKNCPGHESWKVKPLAHTPWGCLSKKVWSGDGIHYFCLCGIEVGDDHPVVVAYQRQFDRDFDRFCAKANVIGIAKALKTA